jgi:tetratricopeptide (TPR) repeat protein
VYQQDNAKHLQAEELLKQVLEGRSKKLRPGHPDTLQTKNNLAFLYVEQQKYEQAEALLKEVLDASAAELGPGNPFTLMCKHNLATVYQRQEKYDLAVGLLKEVLSVQTATLRGRHPDILQSKRTLAAVYFHMKKYDQAIPLFEEALELSKTELGPDHPESLRTQVNLAINYRETGKYPQAISLLEAVHRKDGKQPDHAWVGRELLVAYVRAGKTAEATALAAEQIRAAREHCPADSLQLAAALTNAAQGLLEAKMDADAEPLLREALSLREKRAPSDRDTHHARSLLGGALLSQRKYPDAEPLLLNGYRGLRQTEAKILPQVKDVRLRDALERLVRLYEALGKPDEAAKWKKELEAAWVAGRPEKPKVP